MSSNRGQFSSLDTFQVVQEINKSIANHRMNNFYDVGPKTFVMRFGAADSKFRVVFEPGVRAHLTDVDHEKPKIPSYFTLLVRKHIRGWRLHSVSQVGRDRVIDFAFGAGDAPQFHLFLELWGQGNIILTDGATKIISLWKTIKSGAASAAAGAATTTTTTTITSSSAKTANAAATEQQQQQPPSSSSAPIATGSGQKQVGDLYLPPNETPSPFVQITKEYLLQQFSASQQGQQQQNQPLNSVLPVGVYGPQLMKHISLSCGGIDFSKSLLKLSKQQQHAVDDDGFIQEISSKIASAFAEVDSAYGLFSSSSSSSITNDTTAKATASKTNYIAGVSGAGGFAFSSVAAVSTTTTTTTTTADSTTPTSAVQIQQYLAFAKLPLKQFSSTHNFTTTPTPTFCAAADLLFSADERKRLADIAKKQPSAQSREERCRAAIQRRIVELENEGAQRRKCASALVLASDDVDKIVQLVSDALALGTSWKTLTEAIRRQREAAAEEDAKKNLKKKQQRGNHNIKKAKNNNDVNGNENDEDDDDDKIDLGSSSSSSSSDDGDEENGDEDLFVQSSDDEDEDDENGDDGESDQGDVDDERDAKARAADEQRYLLSLIYALDLRKNQMTLQLPDPDHSFDDDDDEDDNNNNNDVQDEDDQDRRLGGPKLVLVVVDIGLTAHENAMKYFEMAKKADRSKSKTEDKEEEAVARAKQSGKSNANTKKSNNPNNNSNKKNSAGGGGGGASQNEANKKKNAGNIPKQILNQNERVPAWFERHFWFITSVGDLVVIPKDAGQSDVLIQKFANKDQDAVVMVDQFGSWPTLVKPRKGLIAVANQNDNNNNNNNNNNSSQGNTSSSCVTYTIANTSLLEAAAATLCRSNNNCWQTIASPLGAKGNKSSTSSSTSKPSHSSSSPCFWCPAAALTKVPEPGSGIKQLPQGAWNVANAKFLKKSLQLAFSTQLCVALVEATATTSASTHQVTNEVVEKEFAAVLTQQPESSLINITDIIAKSSNLLGSTANSGENQESSSPSSMMTMERTSSTVTTSASLSGGNGKKSNKLDENPQQQQQQLPQQQVSATATVSKKALQHQQKKAKLIQKKYGEQDDEDRAIALALIGTKKSKAQELLEQEDQLPKKPSSSPSPAETAGKNKIKNRDNNNSKPKSESQRDEEKYAETEKKEQEHHQQQPPQRQEPSSNTTVPQQQQQQPPRPPRQLSDEAQKNLQEKNQTAALEFLSMRYISSSPSESTCPSTKNSRYLLPVLVPLLTMPMNKCRVLLVPGGEKRSELAKDLAKDFFAVLGAHLGKADENFPVLVSKIQNDDILLQLPPTAKVQTPFRASLVTLPAEEIAEQKNNL